MMKWRPSAIAPETPVVPTPDLTQLNVDQFSVHEFDHKFYYIENGWKTRLSIKLKQSHKLLNTNEIT